MDEIDEHLLAVLAVDGRASMAALGRRVGLSRTAVLARVRRLEDDGVIGGYGAKVRRDPAAHVARVALVVSTPDVGRYVRRLLGLTEVTEAESVAGEYDLLVRIETATAGALDDVLNRITAWPSTVRTTTFVVLAHHAGRAGTGG